MMRYRNPFSATVSAVSLLLTFAAVPVYGDIIITSGSTTFTPVYSCTKHDPITGTTFVCKGSSLIEYVATQEGTLSSDQSVAFGGKWDEISGQTYLQCDDNNCPNFTATGTEDSGTWSFSSSWDGFVKYILASWSDQTYVFEVPSSGEWSVVSPQQITHIAGYAIVPLPAAVWLFGSAIAGLAILRRRQRLLTA